MPDENARELFRNNKFIELFKYLGPMWLKVSMETIEDLMSIGFIPNPGRYQQELTSAGIFVERMEIAMLAPLHKVNRSITLEQFGQANSFRLNKLPQQQKQEVREFWLAGPKPGLTSSSNGSPATSPADLKWNGIPLPVLGSAALNEFGSGFRAGASGQISDDWMLQLEAKISGDPIGFKLGYARGVLSGLVAGLKNLFETLFDLAKLSIALSPPALLIAAGSEAFFLITDPKRVELRTRQIQEAQRIVTAAKATIDDINQNPDDYVVLSREVGEALGKSAGNWFSQDFLQRSAVAIGEAVGEVLGQVLFEIILQIVIELTTAGVGNAAKASSVAAGMGAKGGTRVAKIVEAIKPALKRTKGLQKFIQLLIKDERGMLGTLRIPKVVQMMTGNRVLVRFDQKLVQIARELRLTQAGLSVESFREINIAVARVRVNGQIVYLDAGNIPGKLVGTTKGLHSEELVLGQIQGLKGPGKTVVLEQWYSERIPCQSCKGVIANLSSEAGVFFTVGEGANRGEMLMRAYGLIP